MGSIMCLQICSLLGLLIVTDADLQLGLYTKTCPKAESIVFQYNREHIPHARSLAAAVLRMHFHDCFVRGCHALVLLNSISKTPEEKRTPPNLSLRGFSFIDQIKSLVEKECLELFHVRTLSAFK
ncbi:peroxidase 39-like [Dioscorea cayenensis subsp. rotundata]|uniref:Peroxidase 39-like n=1 Tax=Dioscorea cayennensis subsp. rotundata TaxID=55577 RepID=A0AB40C337_DIOCR|nr:peroxidase 39-like [Dioscorea cayenensis subsp. rotundata]